MNVSLAPAHAAIANQRAADLRDSACRARCNRECRPVHQTAARRITSATNVSLRPREAATRLERRGARACRLDSAPTLPREPAPSRSGVRVDRRLELSSCSRRAAAAHDASRAGHSLARRVWLSILRAPRPFGAPRAVRCIPRVGRSVNVARRDHARDECVSSGRREAPLRLDRRRARACRRSSALTLPRERAPGRCSALVDAADGS